MFILYIYILNFREDSVPRTFSGDEFEVRVDSRKATIDLAQMKVNCAEDSMFEQIVQTGMEFKNFFNVYNLVRVILSISKCHLL